jgi:single-strand DNA-binding protein
MLDSYVTVIGTVLNTPERRLTKNNATVAHFRIASHPRRYDRDSREWVDAPSLRIRVNCWRRLAENVCGSLFTGDPVIVYGRISTRDWTTDQGEQRVTYEIEAVSVGPDLNRGTSSFTRQRAEPAGLVVEDDDGIGEVAAAGAAGASGDRDDTGYDDLSYADSPSTVDATGGVRTAEPGDGEDGEEDETGDDETSGASGRRGRRGRQPVAV